MRNKADKRLWTLSIVGCVIVVLTVLFVSIKVETNNVKNRIHSTIEYIRDQYSMYNSFNDAVEAKSLVRMVEKVQQTARNFKADDQALEKEHLKQYAGEQKLTGIIVLNDKDQQIAQYHMGSRFQKVMDYVMEKETLRDVKKYPQKSYMARIDLKNGGYIDLASYGRIDAKGTIIGYQYIKAEYAKNSELTIKNVLAGYKQENDGTIVITNGNDIIASNDKKLINTKAQNNPVVNEIRKSVKSGQFAVIQNGIKRYFTSLDKGRNYYIYMYAEDKDLVKTLMSNIGIALILYGIFVTILMTIKAKSNQQYELIQKQREEEYKKELEKSAREAKKANIAKTEFLQRMSHDIRTPINGIRGMVEVGDYYKDNLVKQAECRKKIWEASGFLLELINEVLDMGKLESEEVILEERSFNFFGLFKEIRMVIEKQAKERGIQIVVHKYRVIHENLIGSPLHVKRVVMNILTNAIKYNKDNGKIIMEFQEVQEDQDTVRIQFKCKDTGIGMSESFQKKIYEPFAQEKAWARTVYGGTGLGMPITKSLVEKMGGTISFESEQDVGTTFDIEIPFQIDHNKQCEEHKKKEVKETSIKGVNVLLAEDNELNMEIAEFVLESAGAKVIKAFNGKEALEIFKASEQGEIDVILMDVMMPVMDGLEAARYIRRSNKENARDIPIIAMTANAFTEDRRRVLEAGMNEHLAKPLESEVLIEMIAKYCGK
ncbi:response regulator [Anaerostipes amylophilus]|uniref:response regulator n=1 Tax=Anaerostipes amylophilus TaxID=2981779 RepID=UPI0006C0F607|nr:response regulator [Anaerostipes amylophilus]MCU6781735.1 response regulator [Anaerostipes amylophilus]CUO21927.1 Sensory/regulatory protein RpfC [Anaerostipes hadrus]